MKPRVRRRLAAIGASLLGMGLVVTASPPSAEAAASCTVVYRV